MTGSAWRRKSVDNGRGHPRSSGTYAKVLGKYVREERVLTLIEALRRMTARRLEHRVPAMAAKGRIKIGVDADITIFDPATVIDHAYYVGPDGKVLDIDKKVNPANSGADVVTRLKELKAPQRK